MRTAYEHHYVSGSYSSSPVVERSSELYSAYLQADCLAPLRLGPSIGCFGDGDDVATDVEGLLPGLVHPVVCGDDVAHGSYAVVGSNDPNLLTLKATLKESIDGLPKRGKMPPAAEVMTRTDAQIVMTNNNKEVIGMLNGLRYNMDQLKATYDLKLQEKDTVIERLNERIVKLSLALEKSQQYNNRDSFKICGIREPTGLGPNEREDTEKTVTTFFEKARIPVPKEELSITHRLPSRDTTRSKPLLVKLKSRILRNQVMRKKKGL